MKMKLVALVSLLICALLLAACGAREPDGSDRETLPKESYVTVTDEGVTHRGGLDKADFSADSAAGEWLTQCSASDRDEQFDAYTLRRETSAGEETTFTYAVYYPHLAHISPDVEDVLHRSGFLSYEPGMPIREVNMRTPVVLIQNLETTIQEPLNRNPKVYNPKA